MTFDDPTEPVYHEPADEYEQPAKRLDYLMRGACVLVLFVYWLEYSSTEAAAPAARPAPQTSARRISTKRKKGPAWNKRKP